MKLPKYTWWDMVKEAFFLKVQTPILGKIPLNFTIFAGMSGASLFNPELWWPTIGGEAAYLVIASGSKAVQKSLTDKYEKKRLEAWDAKKIQMISSLSIPLKQRFKQFQNIANNIANLYQITSESGLRVEDSRIVIVNQLMWLALKLLYSRDIIIQNIKDISLPNLKNKIGAMENDLSHETNEKLKKTLEATLDTMKKRLAGLERVESKIKEIDLELLRIEEQLALIHSSMAIDSQSTNEELSREIDKTAQSLAEADEWMQTNRDLFGSLETEFAEQPPDNSFIRGTYTT